MTSIPWRPACCKLCTRSWSCCIDRGRRLESGLLPAVLVPVLVPVLDSAEK
jgi:hypothetical protein